ncbi:glycosyltransferase family 25 protein [Martelella soudanensis]|uniref:glycosyltransferase family 25 protein n=1 Tax=unclassified Martelella TaxID=2629616 RepID=UPI0015DEE0C2|nr:MULTISPECIES: glycosyltransferase family 25 protein [unclassified Martelella]
MLIYAINLRQHADRRKHLADAFGAAGLNVEWIEAVDGRTVCGDEIVSRGSYPKAGSHALTPTQYGCYLSHVKCWQAFLETEAPLVAIFEDDVHLAEDIGVFLEQAESWFPEDGDIVKLETCLQPVRLESHPADTVFGRGLFRLQARHLGAAAYILSRKGAHKLLENSDKLAMGVDAAMFDPRPLLKHKMINYQIDPAICIQDDIAYRCGLPRLGFCSNNPVPRSRKSHGTNAAEYALYVVSDGLRRLRLCLRYKAGGYRKRVIDFRQRAASSCKRPTPRYKTAI